MSTAVANTISLPLKHNPELAVASHGWARLHPFYLHDESLTWIAGLPDSGASRVEIIWSDRTVARTADERYGSWGEYAFLAYKMERVLRGRNYVDA